MGVYLVALYDSGPLYLATEQQLQESGQLQQFEQLHGPVAEDNLLKEFELLQRQIAEENQQLDDERKQLEEQKRQLEDKKRQLVKKYYPDMLYMSPNQQLIPPSLPPSLPPIPRRRASKRRQYRVKRLQHKH